MTAVRKGYADTSFGQVHYAECGSGAPVVLLHQTPRSWDEYREVLPLLGRTHRAIAMDTIGFGASAPLAEHRIENYAAAVVEFLDALGLDRATLAGHHTGGVVAIEVAARAPERVERLVLSSTPYVDAAARETRRHRPAIDHVEVDPGGGHLTELWRRRQSFYPTDRPDLFTRLVRDALVLGPDVEKGHEAVSAYRMEDRIGLVRCPVLCVGASADPFSFPELEALSSRFNSPTIAVVEGGMVPLMELHPSEVADLIARFAS
ncbi:alpha/beta hydrolase [Actinoallomurus purpureus]|uniref:alpha/beta fold hydrolase n=1 Tax=Actinoallomurus purpureus TaxID=478114 RepID=UPI0020924EE4|nr:alpha/beta hydrolase [Actinoallomurus purpureus]MCO6005260.1 alpha/beta hydrolase [Actinoallomurus purpureus]